MAINEELRSKANTIVIDVNQEMIRDKEDPATTDLVTRGLGLMFDIFLEGLNILDDIRTNTKGKLSDEFRPGRP